MNQKHYIATYAAIASLATSAQANLITNGDFSTGDLTDWTVTLTDNGTTEISDATVLDVTSGYAATFRVGEIIHNLIPAGISLQQTFHVDVAGHYDVGADVAGFAFSSPNASGGEFTLLIDGNILDFADIGFINAPSIERDVLAGSLDLAVGLHTISILVQRPYLGTDMTPRQFVDNIFVSASAVSDVPLPAAALFLITGLGGIGFSLRRQGRA